jgi:hypothetical protein
VAKPGDLPIKAMDRCFENCGKNQLREVLPLFQYFKDLKRENQPPTHNNRLADTVHLSKVMRIFSLTITKESEIIRAVH